MDIVRGLSFLHSITPTFILQTLSSEGVLVKYTNKKFVFGNDYILIKMSNNNKEK